jgi:hypothetical protein
MKFNNKKNKDELDNLQPVGAKPKKMSKKEEKLSKDDQAFNEKVNASLQE